MNPVPHIIRNFPINETTYALEHPVINHPMEQFECKMDQQLEWNILPLNETAKESIQPYLPSKRAKEVVKLAQILNRPILLQGEPGSGKTKLAQAVAYDWYGKSYKGKYFEWHIKSNSKAVEGIYSYDHVARLRDASVAKNNGQENTLDDLTRYLSLGPLGMAFLASTPEEPAILLIDEIDKADIDFPNDLLLELDEKRFRIKEPGIDRMYEAKRAPVIFITSNNERGLPAAFLRRCLYLYFKFPGENRLKEILERRNPKLYKNEQIREALMKRFDALRNTMTKDPTISRVPSTSEFLDWVQAIEYHLIKDPDRKITEKEINELLFSTVLLKSTDEMKVEKLFDYTDD